MMPLTHFEPLFDRLAAEELCEIPTLSLQEESTSRPHHVDSSANRQPTPNAPNEFDIENLLMLSPPINAQSSMFYTTPDAADLEPHLQAMFYPPGDTLQYFSGDGGMMDGVLTLGNQNTFSDLNGYGGLSGLSPWYGTGDQGF